MVQCRDGSRFLLEAPQPLGVLGETRRQYLDRDFTSQPRILRAIHLAHAAGADRAHHFVRAEFRSCRECHFFFKSASQFVTRKSGDVTPLSDEVFTRSRLPSAATSKSVPTAAALAANSLCD